MTDTKNYGLYEMNDHHGSQFGPPLHNHSPYQRGFSLLEVLVASVLLAIAVIGTGSFFVSSQVSLEQREYARCALHAARSKMEQLQGLPFVHADLKGSFADAGLAHEDQGNPITIDDRGTTSADDDLEGYRRWIVFDKDDQADGEGEGEPDYKEVRVDVAEDAMFQNIRANLRSLVAP